MLKRIFFAVAIIFSAALFFSCSQDAPDDNNVVIPADKSDNNQTTDPDDPENPGNQEENETVTINGDGSTSSGVPYRKINETNFMLNYVEYKIESGHLEVTDVDDIEVEATLKGIVKVIPYVIIDGTKYVTRAIYRINGKNVKEIVLPNTITQIHNNALASYLWQKNTSLERINLPESLIEIGYSAFEIVLPSNLLKFPRMLK